MPLFSSEFCIRVKIYYSSIYLITGNYRVMKLTSEKIVTGQIKENDALVVFKREQHLLQNGVLGFAFKIKPFVRNRVGKFWDIRTSGFRKCSHINLNSIFLIVIHVFLVKSNINLVRSCFDTLFSAVRVVRTRIYANLSSARGCDLFLTQFRSLGQISISMSTLSEPF